MFVVAVMGSYWMAEVMPLAATALMPVFLLPMLGILKSKPTCQAYLPVSFDCLDCFFIIVIGKKCFV